MRIDIETSDGSLFRALFEGPIEAALADGVVVHLNNAPAREGMDLLPIVSMTIEVAKHLAPELAAGVIAHWLYQRLSHRTIERIRIDQTAIEFDQDAIRKVVRSSIELERRH